MFLAYLFSNFSNLIGGFSLVTIILLAFLIYLCITQRKRPEMAHLPGYWTLPIIGLLPHTPRNLNQVIPTVTHWAHTFPDLGYGYLLGRHYVMLSSARAVESVLSSRELIDKGRDYDPLLPWFGLGLLTASGQRWYRHRKLITPAFHFSALDDFITVMDKHASSLVQQLDGCGLREPIDVWPLVANTTLAIICETAMGVKVNAKNNAVSEYLGNVKGMSDIIYTKVTQPWTRLPLIRTLYGIERKQSRLLKHLLAFSSKVIEERKQERYYEGQKTCTWSSVDKNNLSFLDMLLDASQQDSSFTNEDIREEVDTFMFEGHDTTTSGVNWAIYNIGRSPQVQKLIHEELLDVLGDACGEESDGSCLLDRAFLSRLTYLEAAIKESLRLYPPVTFFSRRILKDTNVLGYHISADTDVVINTYNVHRDPNHWPDPERYDPSRFLPVPDKKRNQNLIPDVFDNENENCSLLHNPRIDNLASKDRLIDVTTDINFNKENGSDKSKELKERLGQNYTQCKSLRQEQTRNGTKGNRHPYCYIPFSAGARNCIGQRFAMMEMKVVIAHLLRAYHIESVEDHASVRTKMSMTLQKDGPLLVKFTRRNRFYKPYQQMPYL